jgi:hypothetical protein
MTRSEKRKHVLSDPATKDNLPGPVPRTNPRVALLLRQKKLRMMMMKVMSLPRPKKRKMSKHKLKMKHALLQPRRSKRLIPAEKQCIILAPSRVCNI